MNAVYLPYTPGQEVWYFEQAKPDLSCTQIRLGRIQALCVDEKGNQYLLLAAEPIGTDQPIVSVPIENAFTNLYELVGQVKRALNHIDNARHERLMTLIGRPVKCDPTPTEVDPYTVAV